MSDARPTDVPEPSPDGDVRLATPADVGELVRLRRLMFEAMGLDTRDDRWERGAADVIGRDLAQGRLVAVVVDAPDGAGGLAASGIAQFAPHVPGPANPATTRAYLSSMSTDPRWRRRGYGTRILDRLMDECRARSAGVIELHATDTGRILYERVGFVPRPGAPEMQWTDPATTLGSAHNAREPRAAPGTSNGT